MDETAERAAVVAAALTYLGTPYHPHGMIRGVGVDCATLIKLAFEEAAVRPPMDIGDYAHQWHMHRREPLYEEALAKFGGREVMVPGLGDVVLYKVTRYQFAHGAIVTGLAPLRIIHAYSESRAVLEGAETEFGRLTGAEKKIFTAW